MKTIPEAIAFVFFALASTFISEGARPSSYIMLHEYSVLSDGTIRDDQGWLKTDGSFTNVIRDDSGLLNMLGVTADDIAPFGGRPTLSEISWNAYESIDYMPHSWVRSRATFSFLDSPIVIIGIKGKTDPNPAITILNQPINEGVLLGDSAFFYCGAEPWLYLSYQWRFKGKDMPGKTDSFLSIPNVAKANAGIYRVALSTGSKPIFSNRVLLRAVVPVTLKTQPKSQTVKAGHGAVFRVTAQGTGPLFYNWFHNGEWIFSNAKTILSIPHVKPEDAGEYHVEILNNWSGATTTNAVLTVVP